MVPLEAMAVGCPVICGDFSSIEESVGDAGIVCNAGDLASMEDWFIKLMDERIRNRWSERSTSWANRFDSVECSEAIVSAVADVVQKMSSATHLISTSNGETK